MNNPGNIKTSGLLTPLYQKDDKNFPILSDESPLSKALMHKMQKMLADIKLKTKTKGSDNSYGNT